MAAALMGWLQRNRREDITWEIRPARLVAPGLLELVSDVRVPQGHRPAFLGRCLCFATDLAWELSRTVAAADPTLGGSGARIGSIGWVGLQPGEPPVLLAMAPRRDLVAARVAAAMTGGRLAAMSHLWLGLAPGVFLGHVVNPDRCLAVDLSEVRAGLVSGAVAFAMLVAAQRGRRMVSYSVHVAGRAGTLRWIVHRARGVFSARPDRARTANPATAIIP